MKYYFEKLSVLIRDHTFITAAIGIVIALLSSAYAIGFQLGQNRQVYLEDRISALQNQIVESSKIIDDARSEIKEKDLVIEQTQGHLQDKIQELQVSRSNADRLVSLEATSQSIAAELSGAKRKVSDLRVEVDRLNREKADTASYMKKLSAENDILIKKNEKFLENLNATKAAYDSLKNDHEKLKAYKTKIEGTIFQAAAGDLVAGITNDRPWLEYFRIKDVSKISTDDFPYVAMLGSTYKIEGDVIYDVTNGARKVVFAGEPQAAAIGDQVCFGYLTKTADKRLKANAVCRKNEVTSRGVYD